MQVYENLHAVRICFNIPVAPGKSIRRDVYSFIWFEEKITLVDSGVSGAHSLIYGTISEQGRKLEEIGTLILSHSHPDHIGSAKKIKTDTDCCVVAHVAEKKWIEDPDKQFFERPVPGFHQLVGGPVRVDQLISDGDTLQLGKDISCQVLHTPGHSAGSISLFSQRKKRYLVVTLFPYPAICQFMTIFPIVSAP